MPKIAYFHKKLTKVVTFDTAPVCDSRRGILKLYLSFAKLLLMIYLFKKDSTYLVNFVK